MVDRVLQSRTSPPPYTEAPSHKLKPVGEIPVVFLIDKQRVVAQVSSGTTILGAALALDLELRHYCGGNCSCGTCRVEVVEGTLSARQSNEEVVLGMEAADRGDRLACQAAVSGPVTVRIPEWF
jgi:2Fe-2S ferredoxin